MTQNTPYPPIAEYAFISDCRAAALVSSLGSVDWSVPAITCMLHFSRKIRMLSLQVSPAYWERVQLRTR